MSWETNLEDTREDDRRRTGRYYNTNGLDNDEINEDWQDCPGDEGQH